MLVDRRKRQFRIFCYFFLLEGEVKGMNEEKEFFKVSEVARMFNVTTATVYTWVGQGKIPHYKLVGAIRLKKSDLQEWFKSKKRG